MVSYKFCEKLLAQVSSEKYQLTVFGEEARPAYDRVHLSEYFNGKSADDLCLATRNWYEAADIDLRTGELVTGIDRENQVISTHRGILMDYDYLVLATGSYPFVPPIDGVDKKGVFVYRTIDDLDAIIRYTQQLEHRSAPQAVVMGGGLLGLEAAKAMMDLSLPTHVVEFASRLMPRQLDEGGAAILQATLERLGLQSHLNKNTKKIGGNGRISHLEFADKSRLQADMLVISAGIRPRDELAREVGLEVGVRGGVIVDNLMQSSDPNILAIGEVALYREQIYGLVAPGYDMAEVAISTIFEGEKQMQETVDMSTQLKLIGVDVASFGDAFPSGEKVRSIVFEDKLKGIYKKIHISQDGKQLLGGILVGDASDYNMLLQFTQNAMALPPNPEDLILGTRGGEESILGSVLDLPDSAVICSCESVSKGQICEAVLAGGCENVKAVSACTKATNGCGGCKPMVKDLVEASLESLGKEIKQTICEHFPFSRQELHDLIKVKAIHDYDQALIDLGQGGGCEVCQPALASLFATIYNETANRQASIQDTNDRYLANIQRNGTYSVVPRIPAGEISPDKLMVIGQVAKKYDLYTKITGAQRIDLFGARVDQLPDIWEELIAAGFESGHAYGKSLRAVKSCVGSTWCRYGMDESVSFAIELEERYKGLRSPHKLKGGVSGCIRECAEARCKDFGVIAVEGGWNLYVCGNGGANPKHAQLLAEKIDSATCLKYIDRFLMFYLKTAPPLTRTAAWLEKLEGGIDYLKQVVVMDSLEIGEELETEMELMVDTYACEWKEVVENPILRARFRHFVNSDETDDQANFVPLRDQKMPSPWAGKG